MMPQLPRYFIAPQSAVDQLRGYARFVAARLEPGWYIVKVEEFNHGHSDFGRMAGVERMAKVLSREAISVKLSSGTRTRLAKHGVTDTDDTMVAIEKLDERLGCGLLP